ncbi:hypothetical protein B1B_18004, partial [mine drainage metagenome]
SETLQPKYSLVEPSVEEEILPYAKAHRIGVIVHSPMGVWSSDRHDDGRTGGPYAIR